MSTRHEVRLDGLFPFPESEAGSAPTIVQSMRQEFVDHLLNSLKTAEGRYSLADDIAKDRVESILSLFQPVHRVFHPVVVQAWCMTHRRRLNPKRVVSAGLVVRRVSGNVVEGWMKEEGKVLGWRALPSDWETMWDPSAKERLAQRTRKTPYYHQLSSRTEERWEEDSVALFQAPPEVCTEAKATLFFGIPPLASMEVSEDVSEPPFTETQIAARLPKLLTSASAELYESAGLDSVAVFRSWQEIQYESDVASFALFSLLKYLAFEVGAFAPDDPADELKNLFAGIPITCFQSDPRTGLQLSDLWTYLQFARDVLLGETEEERTGIPDGVRLPEAWPVIDTFLEGEIVAAISTCMKRRWARYASAEGRFQGRDSRYVISAFMRVRLTDGAEPVTVWSSATEPFRIKPWHAASPVPPVVVPLPELDQDSMKRMKPSVAFQVPPSIQNFMEGIKLKSVMDGKKPKPGDSTVLKLCCFSIPIVTICAFIVLQVFLSLLNIFLGWMPFARICFPVLKSGKSDGGA